jgi:hypothetical protein
MVIAACSQVGLCFMLLLPGALLRRVVGWSARYEEAITALLWGNVMPENRFFRRSPLPERLAKEADSLLKSGLTPLATLPF